MTSKAFIKGVSSDSKDYEYYTNKAVIEAARATMGGIDLDPASCAYANKTVKAYEYLTKRDNGLNYHWCGRVWLNHPFSRGTNAEWIKQLVEEYVVGNIKQACCITYTATSEDWLLPLMAYPQCFLHGRRHYYKSDKEIHPAFKGSVVTYLGRRVDSFYKNFKHLGTVKVLYK